MSSTQRVHAILRHAILIGILPPGAWLRQDDITAQLAVSRTPVREACRILSREGLVEMIPSYGTQVSSLSIEEFEEIYAVRKGIEGLAIRRAVRCLSVEQFEHLRRFYESLYPLSKHGDLPEYLREEWVFRTMIYRIGSSEKFMHEIQSFREQSERYLRYAYTFENSMTFSYNMHREILNACEQRDADLAEHLVQQALEWTLKTAGPVIAKQLEQEREKTSTIL